MARIERSGNQRWYSGGGAVLVIAGAVLLFGGCEQATFEYYNPLDPQEDALVEQVVAGAALDPNVEGEILNQWSGSRKSEVDFISVFDIPISSVAGLEFFPELTSLELNLVQLRGVDLTPILSLSNLDSLNLMNNGYTDSDLADLPHFSQINYLSLGYNPILDAASANVILERHIADGDRISLDLQSTPVAHDTLASLRYDALDGLHIGYLTDTGGADAPLTDTDFLPADNSTLRYLDISGPHAPDMAGVRGLDNLQELSILRYQGTDLTAISPVDTLVVLNVDQSDLTSLDGLDAPDLWILSVRNSSSLEDIQQLASGGMQDSLRHLEVQQTGLADEDLAVIWAMSNLTWLEASGLADPANGNPTITDLTGISNASSLEHVDFADNPDLSHGIADLAALPRLESVDLQNTGFSATDIEIQNWSSTVQEIVMPDGSTFNP
jgi:Leucine-rich repeat (LRR) protein